MHEFCSRANCPANPYNQMVQQPQNMYPVSPTQNMYPPSNTTAMPALPTGIPTGTPMAPMPMPTNTSVTQPILVTPDGEQVSTSVLSPMYTQGFLRTQIGKKIKVEFLIGTNMLVDREGTLVGVGTSYILIQETETDDILMADLYSIKFVKIYY